MKYILISITNKSDTVQKAETLIRRYKPKKRKKKRSRSRMKSDTMQRMKKEIWKHRWVWWGRDEEQQAARQRQLREGGIREVKHRYNVTPDQGKKVKSADESRLGCEAERGTCEGCKNYCCWPVCNRHLERTKKLEVAVLPPTECNCCDGTGAMSIVTVIV